MRIKMRCFFADSSRGRSRVVEENEPCPTITAEGIGVSRRHQYELEEDDVRIKMRCFDGESRVAEEDEPCPTITAQGIGIVRHQKYDLEVDDVRIKLRDRTNPHRGHSKTIGEDEPCPAIMGRGIGGVHRVQYDLEEGGPVTEVDSGKPPYAIPTMDEVRAVPWNGFTVASTFAGCGGSCLGYRMAGFRVVWANEFVAAARDSYQANANEGCHLDPRDVAVVQPEDVLEAAGLEVGELDVLDGSPPCQAFSTAGKRERGWGEDYTYEGGARQKNETLFDQYVRLLRGLQPRAFVAENVSGLVKGTAKGFFLEILAGLKGAGYRVRCKVLDAKWLGVPQSRQRTIFVGVREDLDLEPAFPPPLPYLYTLRDALPHVGSLVRDPSSQTCPKTYNHGERPVPAIAGPKNAGHFKVADDLDSRGAQLNPEVPSPTIRAGRPWNPQQVEPETTLDGYAVGDEFDRLNPGQQSDKYFSLVRPEVGRPAPTIQASHGSPGIACVTHPVEKRKFTIAELRRICAFPADFELTGSYAQQWERLGNSVPPLMMRAIAEVVRDRILVPARGG